MKLLATAFKSYGPTDAHIQTDIIENNRLVIGQYLLKILNPSHFLSVPVPAQDDHIKIDIF